MSDFQKWSVLAFRAMDDAGRVLMTIEPESTTEGERLDQLKETIRELLTQVLLLNGVYTRRQLDERFQFGKLDTDALNVQLGQQQAEPVAQRSDGMPTSKTERELRRMLCVQRHSGAYMDDGEASYCGDKYCRSIDYMRESIESIRQAWYDAGAKRLADAQPEQQAEPVAIERWQWIFEDRHGDRYTHKNLFYTADEAAESARICGVKAIKKIDSSKVMQQAEPVGEVDAIGLNGTDFHVSFTRPMPLGTKLYTAPPQREWVGLTDEEITELRLKTFDAVATNYESYRAIEAKLKEKNT